jgi:hypothetical protein
LDGIRFQLNVVLERLEKLEKIESNLSAVASQIDAISAEVDVLRAHLEAIETKKPVKVSSEASGLSRARENDCSETPDPNRPESAVNGSTLEGTTLLVTHAELCGRHGTGALLLKLLQNEPSRRISLSWTPICSAILAFCSGC